MKTNRLFYILTSIFLILFLGYLSYRIVEPFLKAVAWAIVFSIVFYPVYVFLLRYLKYKVLGSIVTLLIMILIVLGPFTYISLILADEIKDFVTGIDDGALSSLNDILNNPKIVNLIHKVESLIGAERIDIADIIAKNIKKVGDTILKSISSGLANITQMVINFLLMLLTVFFFLKDGPGFLAKVKDYLPFSEEDKDRLISKIKDMIISTIYGGVVVAIVQGTIGGVAFFFLGIKSPVLWGAAICIMSFFPMVGTFSVWGPMTGYLFIQGSYLKGIILLLVGLLGISMVDNILKPIIISGRTKMPTLAVFFSVLGGIKLFGFIGFIMGPIVLTLFVSVFEIFRHIEGGTDVQS
ncbi:MAG: AI-2E family transporter [Nitrospirota bacterium]